jgi:hypothetical protein
VRLIHLEIVFLLQVTEITSKEDAIILYFSVIVVGGLISSSSKPTPSIDTHIDVK